MTDFDDKLRRVLADRVELEPYNRQWPELFRRERDHLLACLPPGSVGRIEHFGSTAVPGLVAKPIVDMLIEVPDLAETRRTVVPILEAQGYDYFWRPNWGDDTPPFYAWFIKRDGAGRRSHHLHMVEADFPHWDRLLFRDYLIEHPEVAARYGALKTRLARAHRGDRVAYTEGKTDFIVRVTATAKRRAARAAGG